MSKKKTKICSKCGIEQPVSNFYAGNNQCKDCAREYGRKYSKKYRQQNSEHIKAVQKEHYQNNKEYYKEWHQQNKDKRKEYYKEWYQKNKNKINKQKNEYYQNNKEYYKEYHQNNKEKINEYNKKYCKKRRKTDVNFKLACSLRARLYHAIKNTQKSGSAVKDLGCSIEELKSHLESKFKPGMTWDNWTTEGWHIDHIKPLTAFDLTDREQFLQACHYTNLQPLWAAENLSKNDKWEGENE